MNNSLSENKYLCPGCQDHFNELYCSPDEKDPKCPHCQALLYDRFSMNLSNNLLLMPVLFSFILSGLPQRSWILIIIISLLIIYILIR